MKTIESDKKNKVEIISFSNKYQESIKRLNYEWLQKYFHVEEGDMISLSNPKEQIIDKGGFIFFAKLNTEIVGTVALLKKPNNVFELGKMAVTQKAQGKGVGKKLLEHCIRVARQKQIHKLILYSNTQLTPAMHLYRKHGFVEVEMEQGLYERANIKMEYVL